MSTLDQWVNLDPGMILNFSELQSNLVEPVRDALADIRGDFYGQDVTVGQNLAEWTYASSTMDLDVNRIGVTPDGWRLAITTTDAAFQNVPFQDTGATNYYLGCRATLVPVDVSAGADGAFHFNRWAEDVGETGAPDSVAINGVGLDFVIDTLAVHVWTVGGTRPVVVYLVNPETGGAEAIYDGTASHVGGEIVITCPHSFGQAAPSTTAAHYLVTLRGPTISTTNLSSTPDYWFHGIVNTGSWNTTGQNLSPSWGAWVALFAAEHNPGSGAHEAVTAWGVDLYGNQVGSQRRVHITAQDLVPYAVHAFEQNGGAKQNGGYFLATAGDPYHVKTITPITGTYAFLELPSGLPHDVDTVIDGLTLGVYMLNATAGQDVEVQLVKRTEIATGISNGVVVATWKITKPAAATWESRNTWSTGPSFPFTVPKPGAGEAFTWRIYFHEANPGQVKVSRLIVDLTAKRIEPL